MKIKLPETKSKLYTGNPLKLEDGEVRDVEHNTEVDLLLNDGAIEPVTDAPSIESKNVPKEIPVIKEKLKTFVVERPTVTRTTRTSSPLEIKKKVSAKR